MNINLNNYEQWLLMYVDNELSATERMQVEEFLRDYPYLAEELDLLRQTVLPLEHMLFDKSSLLKPILDEKTQEKLLMHLDGELPAGESLDLQNSLESDANLQKEWVLLQKTKLDAADIIEHPDKESLYRKERARLITLVRWAVAAVLIGAGLYAGFNLVNKDKPAGIDVATATPAANEQKRTGTKSDNDVVPASPDELNNRQVAINEQNGGEIPVVKEDQQPLKKNTLATTTAGNKKNKINDALLPNEKNTKTNVAATNQQPANKPMNARPKELPEPNVENMLRNNHEIAAIEKPKNNNSIDIPTNINTSKKPIVDKLLTEEANSYASTASFGFQEDNNHDQILMMEEENVSRSKAAIFLKKLKRNVERRTNIKPGKSLKIAGFEFAVK